MPPYCHPPLPSPACPVKPKPFKIEAVIVCVNYSDFLSETLPHNKQMFNRLVVVTAPEDKETQKLCEFHHVQCIVTDAMRTSEGKFCKGAGINVGLAALDKDGWVVHLDADIYLPPMTKIILEKADLDPTCIYGIDRYNVSSYEQWREFLAKPKLQQENNGWVHMNTFPMGTRVMNQGQFLSIGFFQLFCPYASGIFKYPEGHTSAGREDGLFAMQWPRSKRHMIPEIIGYHLESGSGLEMGVNWGGRKSPPFRAKQTYGLWKLGYTIGSWFRGSS